MKKQIYFSFALALFCCFTFVGCLKDSCTSTRKFVRLSPIYLKADDMRTNLTIEAGRPIKQPGKIYYYQNYLIINEVNEGLHIIDNAEPGNPKNVAFWRLKGNVDIAIKDGKMYLDQYADMIIYNVENFRNPAILCRRQDVFSEFTFSNTLGYLVGYNKEPVSEEVDCNINQEFFWRENNFFASADASFLLNKAFGSFTPNQVNSLANSQNAQGVAGSYTRFAFVKNIFYAVDSRNLTPYLIEGRDCPTPQTAVPIGWNIETIFPYKDHLFLGGANGVFIYNTINTLKPQYTSAFVHATGCDPVVVADDLAFVTVEGGTTCRNGTINRLTILDVANPNAPTVIQSYDLSGPRGLALTSHHLYLCDDGIKIYDRSKPEALKLLSHKKIEAQDVIALSSKYLLVIGKNGFYQYDISEPREPKEISKISVQL
jgi:hypothetical protein